jgi:pimeloyl-ACP methyl ester carboxylesterase
MEPLPATTRTVGTADGASLYAEVSGDPDAEVTLVLAHGWTLNSASWEAQATALGGAARIVTYDQRGHGRSERGTAPLSIRLLGGDLGAVLDQLAPSGPVVLAGHSMGGMSVMALAGLRPELFGGRVRGVALVDTAAVGRGRARLGIIRRPLATLTSGTIRLVMAIMAKTPALAEPVRRRLTADRAAALRSTRWLLFGPDAPEAAVAACAAMISATPTRSVGGFYPALRAHDEYASLPALARVPVRVVVGSLDRLTPVSLSRRMAAAIDGAELIVEPDTGHLLQMERPEIVTDALRTLLDAVTGDSVTGHSVPGQGSEPDRASERA